jgi:hypothetical protein
MMRARKMKTLPEDEKQYLTTAEYFRNLKDRQGRAVTDQTPAEERILAVVDDVLRAEDAAVKAGQHFEGTLYLTQQGFLNQEHMVALTSLVGVQRKGLLQPMIEAGRAPMGPHLPGTGQDIDWEKFQRDPVGAEIVAERQQDLAEQAAFAKDRFQRVQARAAYGRLGGKAAFGVDVDEIMSRWDVDLREMIFANREKIELEAQRDIVKRASAQNVPLPNRFGLNARGNEYFVGWERLFEVSQQTAAAGGRALPGPNEAQNAANLQRIADNTERLLGRLSGVADAGAPGVGAPLPSKAAPLPSRP